MVKVIDNINKKLKDDFADEIKNGSKISIAASCFSIYAYEELKSQLKDIEEFRFIFTSPTFTTDKTGKEKREFYIPKLNRERSLCGTEFEIKLRNELSQKIIAKECAEWIRKNKVCFKSNNVGKNMQGFANVDDKTYSPIKEFTTVELGTESGNNLYTMINKLYSPVSKQYLDLFDEIWKSEDDLKEVTSEVLANIENAYKENSPDFIYFIIIYNLFKEFLDTVSEDDLPNEATGFKDSKIWNLLYDFQKDACLAIINKLEKYNGCILADSVGLGKTFTAISVIKYYENRNKSVLVLCPKKLNENWITYSSNYKNNPIAEDRLRYDVLCHSDLSRTGGKSNGLDLDRINWGNYDLVVIDESHNFRNGGKLTTNDDDDETPRRNRYLQLMNKVIRTGVKTKVLMLSATPVNNKFKDLKNQLQLAYEGESEKINKLLNTQTGIDEIFRQAQKAYNEWTTLDVEERTLNELQNRLSFDFFELLDSVTIARSRKHIMRYYNTNDIGKFPIRNAPKSCSPELTIGIDNPITYKEIYSLLEKLRLAVYTPSNYILDSRKDKYGEIDSRYRGLTLVGREYGLKKLMGSNLLKRLESSIDSFRQTVERIKIIIDKSIAEIDQKAIAKFDFDAEDIDIEDQETMLVDDERSGIDFSDMDDKTWKADLEGDIAILNNLYEKIKAITPDHDAKLQQLIRDLENKFNNPINEGNEKVIIFTAFSDTAKYLYDNIAPYIKEKYSLNTALVTGSANQLCSTLQPGREKLDFNKVLTLFSPISKHKDAIYPDTDEEIDVLIATDCISEGQNLQDCDYLINYDIHWNPVRLIQRFGRIDRIGSKNEYIQMVNYWPAIELDEYINLKGRVENRMAATVLTGTGTENILAAEEKEDLEYRHKQLERLKNEVVDIEDMDTGISIMDLGLNEFRLDLLSYIKEHANVEKAPLGLHAVVPAKEGCPPGVVFVLKNINDSVNIDHKNRLHPFYMVYISDNNEVKVNHLSHKELLDKLRFLCKGQTTPHTDACNKFNSITCDGKNMKKYSNLLKESISSIIKVKEDSDIDSWLGGTRGITFTKSIKGIDDFELICFVAIVDPINE